MGKHVKVRNLAILVLSIIMTLFFVSLMPVWAQNSSVLTPSVDGQSEQPALAALNPAWLEYEQNLTAGRPINMTTSSGNSLGYIPSPVDLSYLKGKKAGGAAQTYIASYVPSYDLRTVNKVSPVKNQGNYGTCWAFATFGSLESYLMPELWDFSEYNLAKQCGFDGVSNLNHGGNTFMSTAYLTRWIGPINESDDPYPSVNAEAYAVQKHAQDVYFLPERASKTDNNNIKWTLTTYGGVAVAIYWDNRYYSANPATYYNPSSTSANHEVTIVGWDDNYPKSNFHGTAGAPPGNGAFIVKNSWGTSWGDSGYFHLSYYDSSIQAATGFTAEPTPNYAKEYQYDPLGWVGSWGYGTTTAWAANVFTADNSANPLTAVGFYTDDVNTQYEVYIYTNPTSGPIGATKVIGPKGAMSCPGYHTVKLASPVALNAGQRFSVVVKFVTLSYHYPVAAEYAISGYSSGATASPGQSYMSSSGTSWRDTTTTNSTMNVCIKAFTQGATSPLQVTNGVGATLITSHSARLNGELTGTGGENPFVTIYYGLNDGGMNNGSWTNHSDLGQNGIGTFYADITNLTLGAKYYYLCYVWNSAGSSWGGSSANFTTYNSPPNTPSVPSGPTSGMPRTSYSFSTSAVDPDDDPVSYTFSWGDNTPQTDTGQVDSGSTASASHAWSAAGTYSVKAGATDSNSATSGQSAGLSVTISSNRPPNTPSVPSGVTSGRHGYSYRYSTKATDPDGDMIMYTFDWGDGTTPYGPVKSGTTVYVYHSWASAGTYKIRAMATDSKGAPSGWSGWMTVNMR
jgi:C1A family cysteine protease